MSVYFPEDRCEEMSTVHWEIVAVTYLRDTSQESRKETSYPESFHLSDILRTFDDSISKNFIA